MKKGSIKVDQILKDGTIVQDFDESLSVSDLYNKLKKFFPNIEKISGNLIVGSYNGNKYSIKCKNVTYLGKPHLKYKKRIQISGLKEFYEKSVSVGANPLLLGIYSYAGNTIFVNFDIDTYINKKSNNSSAHVYSDDLAEVCTLGGNSYFHKFDSFNNSITVFKSDRGCVEEFLNSVFNNNTSIIKYEILENIQSIKNNFKKEKKVSFNEDILQTFEDFFINESKVWNGKDCYKKMFEDDFRCKGQAEWVGSYLEYRFEKYIQDKHLSDKVLFYQDRKKGGIDLDLFFPTLGCYGDLKTHSDTSSAIIGNDFDTVKSILENEKTQHIYYIVCECSVNKDCCFDFEVTKYWNTFLQKNNLLSYKDKMKHDATLKRAYILDINPKNINYLSFFHQGKNSNGKARPVKVKIDKKDITHFILKEINL